MIIFIQEGKEEGKKGRKKEGKKGRRKEGMVSLVHKAVTR